MVQSKEPPSKSNITDDERVAVVLQQYNDTKGHFSLVRWAWALVFPYPLFVLTGPQEFSTS
jgi:hypothetical protein